MPTVVQTVARLREFSRPRESQSVREAVDFNEVVRQSVALTRARWQTMAQGKGISIQMEVRPADELPRVMGSESEIRDAVVNLIFNAVDAMPQGGTIILQTRALGDAATIEVRDTGEGILCMVAGTIGITGHNNVYYRSEPLLALGPEHARTIANEAA